MKYETLLACLILTTLFKTTTAIAGIPEPDNAIFGEVTLDGAPLTESFGGVEIEARKINLDDSPGAVLTTYALGDHPKAGYSRYVIKVKVDTDTVTRPGALLRGEKFALFIDGYQVTNAFTTVGISSTNALFRRSDLELSDLKPEQIEIIAHLAGARELTPFKRVAADYNEDALIDTGDVTAIDLVGPPAPSRTAPSDADRDSKDRDVEE